MFDISKYNKEQFKNVYFITGTATGGKTTISKALADKYGFLRYDVDVEFDRHQKMSSPDAKPAMNKIFKNADEFFLRPKEEYKEWLLKNTEEQLEFILNDIIELSKKQIVVCDIHLTAEQAEVIADENQIVFLVRESNENIIDDYCNRKSHEGFNSYINSSSNPALAKKNCNEVLKDINNEREKNIKASKFLWLERNKNSTVENTLQLVEKKFGLIPDLNIFMMCEKLNENALRDIPEGFHSRTCRKDELDIWKEFPFDNENDKIKFKGYMTEYYNNVYKPYGDLFYNVCLFICDENDKPVATCFAWKSYEKYYTIHWLKVLKGYEGVGLGRAILSEVMKQIPANEYPIYLHTQPSSFRAIKLYSDFGFCILTDECIGDRKNQIVEATPYLEYYMGDTNFKRLAYKKSDGKFSKHACKYKTRQF